MSLAGGILVAGLLLRLVPLGLGAFFVKWGGTFLWAAMVYWLVVSAFPRRGALLLASAAGAIAAGVELSRLIHTPGLDAYRRTLAGVLLLGRVFQPMHFVIYGTSIALAAVLDMRLQVWLSGRILQKTQQQM